MLGLEHPLTPGGGRPSVFINRWTNSESFGYYPGMTKPLAIFTILFALAVIGFGTWQLFLGNLEAAFSSFPFLLIIYVFVKPSRE